MPLRFVSVVCHAAAVRSTNCTAMPRAPLLGELDAVRRPERLYRDETYLLKRKAPFEDEKLKKI